MTTAIFSGAQLREEKIRLQAILTVTTKSARAMLHFSRRFKSRTLLLSSEAPKNRHHEFGHRIVQIENHLCSERLGDQRAQHKDVGHIVHVDQIIGLDQRAHCKNHG